MTDRVDDPALLDRAAELRMLNDVVRTASRTGGVLMLTGGAGAGKSALLQAAAHAAERQVDAWVLHAAGVEREADLGYAALHRLLMPVVDALPYGPRAEAALVGAALGIEPGPPPGLSALTSAVVGLLRRLRHERPLLLVGDDLQWMDRATLRLLSLVCRRLEGTGVALLLAQRTGHESSFDSAGVPALELAALPGHDAPTSAEPSRAPVPVRA